MFKLLRVPFVCERPIVEGEEDGVYGRRYFCGPHNDDNEIQLLSLTAEGHEEEFLIVGQGRGEKTFRDSSV